MPHARFLLLATGLAACLGAELTVATTLRARRRLLAAPRLLLRAAR